MWCGIWEECGARLSPFPGLFERVGVARRTLERAVGAPPSPLTALGHAAAALRCRLLRQELMLIPKQNTRDSSTSHEYFTRVLHTYHN